MRAILARVGWTILAFVLIEGFVFRTDLYPSILEPDSTTGLYETQLGNELKRSSPGARQVLAVGHSRMGLLPRIANDASTANSYRYSSIALGGTSPRVWYYGMRTVDPTTNRYAAIWIPVDDYNEPDRYDEDDDHESDLHYIIRRLTIGDTLPFTLSYHSWASRWYAMRGILLKSFVYRRDFQDFLAHPRERIKKARYYERESAGWYYGFEGEEFSLAGIQVDWAKQEIVFPPAVKEGERQMIKGVLFENRPPRSGRETAYFRRWYSAILERYSGSRTRLIFFRVPRGPVVRPDEPPPVADSAIRQIANEPGVTVLPEDTFTDLERPELFGDALHLNRQGMILFSKRVAAMTPQIVEEHK